MTQEIFHNKKTVLKSNRAKYKIHFFFDYSTTRESDAETKRLDIDLTTRKNCFPFQYYTLFSQIRYVASFYPIDTKNIIKTTGFIWVSNTINTS